MEKLEVTPHLRMLRVGGWQLYVWRDGDRQTLIDTGAPGGAPEIAAAVPGLERIVLTHFHTDHTGSAEELRARSGAPVVAGEADAAILRGLAPGPRPVLEDWERPILERVSVGLPWTMPPMTVEVSVPVGRPWTSAAGPRWSPCPGTPGGASRSTCRVTGSCSPATRSRT